MRHGSPDLVDTVIIDGRVVVEGRQLLVCDEREVIEGVMRKNDDVERAYAAYHPSGLTLSEQFPAALESM